MGINVYIVEALLVPGVYVLGCFSQRRGERSDSQRFSLVRCPLMAVFPVLADQERVLLAKLFQFYPRIQILTRLVYIVVQFNIYT